MTSRLSALRGLISPGAFQSGRYSVCLSCRSEAVIQRKFTSLPLAYNASSRDFSSSSKAKPLTTKELKDRAMEQAVDLKDQYFSVSNRLVSKGVVEIPSVDEVIASDPALQNPDYFQVHNLFTARDLFNARVHLGHKLGSLNPRMNDFIFGSRFDSVIFDLDKTTFHLRQALNFTAHVAYRKGIILFISRSPHTMHLVEKTAIECGEYAHCRQWETQVMTNAEKKFGGITRLPDLFIMLNTLDSVLADHTAVIDANKLLIPTVGIVDSNCDPNRITYPIPGNDDTYSAVEFYCKVFKEAILRGKQKRKALEQRTENEPKE